MTILDSLLTRFGYVKAGQQYPPVALQMARDMQYSVPDGSLYQTQVALYQKLTAISTVIDITAEACAGVPFSVKRRTGEDETDIPNHPYELRLEQPNELQSRFEFLRDYFAYRKLTGNVYVYLNRSNEKEPPAELWIIPTHLCKPVPDGQSFTKGYKVQGLDALLEPWQVMHDKSFNPNNPFVGLSAIESLAVVSRGDYAQQVYSTATYDKNNAKIPGAFAFADMVNDLDWEKMQADARSKWGGMNQSGPMWLRGVGAGGVQWLQMAISPKDMQALDQRNHTVKEIFGKLGPGLLSVLSENSTEANALAGKATFAEYALWPMLQQSAQKITRSILPAYGEGLIGEFDDIRKGDQVLELAQQKEYSLTHTVNEVRKEYYGEEPIEGGDVPVAAWAAASKPAPTFPSQFGGAQPSVALSMLDAGVDAMPDMATMSAEVPAELKAWEHWAVKRIGRTGGREFEPRAIPILQAARIQNALKSCATANDVQQLFTVERGDDLELKRSNDLLERVLVAIEKPANAG